MPLDLYLDDCSNSDLLAKLLQKDGHRVVRPTDPRVELEGEDDEVHFSFAARNGLTVITKNPADFQRLHEATSPRCGVLAVYQDNDPSKDMSDAEIVRAIKNLENASLVGGPSIQGQFNSLNSWRH